MDPILHLSIPVVDLDESVAFYVDVLGCRGGRRRERWCDVWFYGMQVTLQERPDEAPAPGARSVRHFGVTLERSELEALLARVGDSSVVWVDRVHTDFPGTPREQTKAKLLDPSGNVVELKSYADPASALAD